ncbi:MAG: T9SS type A sorting domain-containing protein [Flavobacterium sp.]
MKKITLIIALFAFCQIDAQVMTEGFDTTLNWTVNKISGSASASASSWKRFTTGAQPACSPYVGPGMAGFDSTNLAAGNIFALTSPSFTLVGTNSYSVKFSMYRDGSNDTYPDKLEIHLTTTATTAPTAATLLGTVNRIMSSSPVVSAQGWYTYEFNIPAATAGARFLRLVAISGWGSDIYVDNVSVKQLVTNDLGLQTVNIPSTIVGGSNNIAGSFKNNGSNVITSATLNWQVDGGAISSQNLTGLNLAIGATYSYSHATPWISTPGNYSLKVWVSNPNGSIDNDLVDNEITKTIRVASNSTAKKPLLEKFTSSTCGPCASFNGSVFTPFYTPTNANNISLIDYQVNWPGAGDPYYTAEVGVRRAYYSVNAAPTLFINAKTFGGGTTASLQTAVDADIASQGYFGVTATKNLVGNVMSVSVTTMPYLSGQFRLFAAVIEKTTTGNVATNGETSFRDVMMKMMPDANGTILNCTVNNSITTNLSVDLTGTHVEEYSDLEVIVFVQDYATKEIMNSFVATQQLSTSSFDLIKIKVFPNPSNGVFTIDTVMPTDVRVLDITGKEVFKGSNITNQTPLDLTNLQKGLYLLKLKNESGEQTEKIIIK